MSFDFDKIIKAGSRAAENAKKTATDLAGKGKRQVDLVNEQAKLSRAQRQLGTLVYSLHRNGEENEPLVEKYIQSIAEIEETIESLRAEDVSPMPEDEEDTLPEEEKAVEPEEDGKRFCPQCGSEVEQDALFCNHCGTQL